MKALSAASTTDARKVALPILFDSSNNLHRSLTFHPEQPARIEACIKALEEYQRAENTRYANFELLDVAEHVLDDSDRKHCPFSQQELRHARDILTQIHNPAIVASLEKKCRDSRQRRVDEGKNPLGFVGWIDEDTYVTTESYDVCLRATAAWIRAVDLVNTEQLLSGPSDGWIPVAMALTRPPGHHATANLSNGFCLFNFAAAAAFHYHSLSTDNVRISILDWDVHYGQGISDIVAKFPQSIRYASIHQIPAFPYMGTKREIQHGNVLTIPMVADTTWSCGYQQYFRDALDFLFTAKEWEPDLVIVCAGYDALDSDELASVSLNAKDYGRMTRALMDKIKEQHKPCRIVLGLEGGYQLGKMAGGGNLQQALIETVKALLEQ